MNEVVIKRKADIIHKILAVIISISFYVIFFDSDKSGQQVKDGNNFGYWVLRIFISIAFLYLWYFLLFKKTVLKLFDQVCGQERPLTYNGQRLITCILTAKLIKGVYQLLYLFKGKMVKNLELMFRIQMPLIN